MGTHRQTKATAISKDVKIAVLERDEGICINCHGAGLPEAHFIGKAQGGLGIEENIVTLCRECHRLYDNSEQRHEIRWKLRKHLRSKYPNWDETKLYYKKYDFQEAILINHLTLIGNLTHDPEVRSTPNGVTVTSFTIAVDRKFKDQSGEKKTDFFRVNAWRTLGNVCARHLAKGRKVAVIGELQARTYEAKDGTTRVSLDVQADEVEFLSPKQSAEYAEPEQVDGSGFEDISSDEIPFQSIAER